MKIKQVDHFILAVTNAVGLKEREVVQSLWSGYGSIERIGLDGLEFGSVIVKHVRPDVLQPEVNNAA